MFEFPKKTRRSERWMLPSSPPGVQQQFIITVSKRAPDVYLHLDWQCILSWENQHERWKNGSTIKEKIYEQPPSFSRTEQKWNKNQKKNNRFSSEKTTLTDTEFCFYWIVIKTIAGHGAVLNVHQPTTPAEPLNSSECRKRYPRGGSTTELF